MRHRFAVGASRTEGHDQRSQPRSPADTAGTSTGGYGKNAQGGAFSRQNQMGADNTAAVFDDEENEGRKTGYSTPGYLKEGGTFGPLIPLLIPRSCMSIESYGMSLVEQ